MTIAQQLKVTEFPFIIKNSNGNTIYFEDSGGYWYKCEYDSKDNQIYYENIDGIIEDDRVKEYTMDEIAKALGINVNQLKIKK